MKGIYKHFKGNEYEVIGEAIEQYTGEEYVLYRSLNNPLDFWIRPKEMFFGKKNVNGVMIPRFTKISDVSEDILKYINIYAISMQHSETEKTYRIIDTKDDYFIIDKVDLKDFCQILHQNIDFLIRQIENVNKNLGDKVGEN